MSNFGIFPGKEFLAQENPPQKWLIEGLLKERDALLWVGQEKSGKTLFSMQAFLCCLTTGHPLIDLHNVPEPKKVTYILLEGDRGESQDRIKRLSKSLDINPDNFVFAYLPRLQLHKKEGQFGLLHIIEEIKKYNCHDVVVIDPLYRAFSGSMNNDDIVREVVTNFDILKDALDCTLVIIHHTHKKKFDIKGKVVMEGDDAVFGSVWFKAWASQIILQTYDKATGQRAFFCNTQRSGEIIKECNLELVEPDPLYFKEDKAISKDEGYAVDICNVLQQEYAVDGLVADEIMHKSDMHRTAFYKSIKQLLANNIVLKNDKVRPILYLYNTERGKK